MCSFNSPSSLVFLVGVLFLLSCCSSEVIILFLSFNCLSRFEIIETLLKLPKSVVKFCLCDSNSVILFF